MKKNREQLKNLSYAEKIEYFANQSNMVSINNGNSKTGAACLTCSMPTCSCRDDAPCKTSKACYCAKGRQCFPNVCGSYWRNWRLWQEDEKNYEDQINLLIKMNGLPLFRWNDCGDIPDKNYLKMMVRIAYNNPGVKFLAYTKKYELVNEVLDEGIQFPENFTMRFSAWDKNWVVPNPHNLPMAYVDFIKSELNPTLPEKAFICRGGKETTCSQCRVCFNSKVQNVIFHQH